MGAFFLYNKKEENNVNLDKVKYFFKDSGFDAPNNFELGDYRLILYSKIIAKVKNYITANFDGVFANGTFVYKGYSYEDSLNAVLKDFSKGCLCIDALRGVFVILIFHNGKISILTDKLNQFLFYIHQDKKIISSSFLAILKSLKEKASLNKDVIRENLLTGCIFSNKTIINNINKFDYNYCLNNQVINNVFCIQNPKELAENQNNNNDFNTSVNDMIKYVNKNLKDYSKIIDNTSFDLGLSGGFDSRLILAFILKNYGSNRISVHSNWKKIPDKDLMIAREIASHLKLKLKEVPVIPYFEMSWEELSKTLDNSLIFYDGQIRVNHSWLNQYRNLWYRKKILGNVKFGITGLCGEQFRNNYYFNKKKINTNKWIKEYIIGDYFYNSILNKELKDRIVLSISKTLRKKLKLKEKYLTHYDIKRYYAEIWVISGPGIRNSMENKLTYFVSPFIEFDILKRSYNIIKQLGIYGRFQAKMIATLNKDLAAIKSDCGNFLKTPWERILLAYVANLFGRKIVSKYRYYKKRKTKIEEKRIKIIKEMDDVKYLLNLVNSIGLDLNLKRLTNFEIPFGRVVALGYLLKKYSDKIEF